MLRGVFSNWVVIATTIVVTYFLTPFILSQLGRDGYGTWLIITSMTSYLQLLALGTPMASVRTLVHDVAAHDPARLNRSIGTYFTLYLWLGGAAFLAGGVAFLAFGFYDVPAELRPSAELAFGLVVAQVMLSFVGNLPQAVLVGHQRFVTQNVLALVVVLLRATFTVVLLHFVPTLTVLALIQLGLLLVEIAVNYLAVRRAHPLVRFRPLAVDFGALRPILAFSVYVLVLNVGVQLSFSTDALVIGAMLGIEEVPFFAIANSLAVYLMGFVVSIAAVVMPTATRLEAEGRGDALRQMFLKWSKHTVSLTLVAVLFLLVCGQPFLAMWINPAFAHRSAPVLHVLMAAMLVYLPIRGVAQPLLMGLGQPGPVTLTFLACSVVNVLLSIALAPSLGLVGVALGTAIPNAAFAVVALRLACRAAGVPVGEWLRYSVGRPLLGAGILAPALVLWTRLVPPDGLVGLVTAGLFLMVGFATVGVLVVYAGDPDMDLRAQVERLLGHPK